MKNSPGTNYFVPINADVNVALTSEDFSNSHLAVLADCDGNPNVVAIDPDTYAVGCYMIRQDILSGNNVYLNQGTIASPSWVLIGSGGGGSSDALTQTITQTAHGFTVGEVVRHFGGVWTLAQADSVSDAEALAIVTTVTDVNNFIITLYGFVNVLTGLTADTEYFLSPTVNGALTSTIPTTPGQVVKPLLYAVTTTTGYFINYRGELLTSPVTGGITSINADTTAAQLLTIGTSGTDFAIVDAGGGSHVFNLPIASATNTGKLANSDWTTFNNKQSALSFGNLTDAGTDGIVVTGGTGAVIGSGTSLAQHVADTTHNGYLSSTDWNTFNGKGTGTVTAVSVASTNGFAGTSSGGATPALTLSTTITGILKGNGTAISAASAGTDYLTPTATGLVEQWGGNDINSSIGNNTYTIMLYAEYGMTINELKIISASGTCTAAVKIGSTAVTGISAVSVSSSIATGTASGANTVSAGNTVTLVLSSTSSLNNLQWTLKTTRT